VLTDHVEKLAGRFDQLAARFDQLAVTMRELAEAQNHTDGRLNTLINGVDHLIRKRPPQ
jgi:hypothetical protein